MSLSKLRRIYIGSSKANPQWSLAVRLEGEMRNSLVKIGA